MKKRKLSANLCSKKSSDCKWFYEDFAVTMECVSDPPVDGDTSRGSLTAECRVGGKDDRERKINLIVSKNSGRIFKVPKYLHQGFIENCSKRFMRGKMTMRLSSLTNILVLCVFVLTLSLTVQSVHGDQIQPETHMPSLNDTGGKEILILIF